MGGESEGVQVGDESEEMQVVMKVRRAGGRLKRGSADGR